MHINLSVKKTAQNTDGKDNKALLQYALAGILRHIEEITAYLNPVDDSYRRLGSAKAPAYISWGRENRSQLIRIPTTTSLGRRAELRSPDPLANPYLAFALIIYAALDGVKRELYMPKICDFDPAKAAPELTKELQTLPDNIEEAKTAAKESSFISACLPAAMIDSYSGL